MRVLVIRAILGLAIVPFIGNAQFGLAEARGRALWQIQSADAAVRPAGSHLGISLVDVDPDRARMLKLGDIRGVEVKAVEEGSPAENAGILAGDVLLSYNGENILGAQQLIRLVQETPADRKIKVQFWRDGKERSAVIVTGARPSADARNRIQGFSFSTGQFYPRTATVVPRPLLVWRDLVLGVEFEELDSPLSEYFGVSGGVLIRAVEKTSPADKSGLRAGDVITSASNKPISTARDFVSCLRKPGTPISLTVVRNHKKLTLQAPEGDQ